MNPSDSLRPVRPRARRFSLDLSVRYRARGATAWLSGRTVNMSHTGVLFWTENVMDVNTGVDMSFKVPVELNRCGAEIICKGEIVRTVRTVSPGPRLEVAARILAYRFVRGGKSES